MQAARRCCHSLREGHAATPARVRTFCLWCETWGAGCDTGQSLSQVLTIKNSDIAKHLSLPPVKLHCSMLAEDAIKAAVRDIKARHFTAQLAAAPCLPHQPSC